MRVCWVQWGNEGQLWENILHIYNSFTNRLLPVHQFIYTAVYTKGTRQAADKTEKENIMKRQQIAHFSIVGDRDTFIPDFEPNECYSLKDFLSDLPNAYFKSGVWNEYKLISMQEAIARCKTAPWGADIYIEWNEAWELGQCDGELKVYFSCPCDSDMW